jgi:heat shock protein HslJ
MILQSLNLKKVVLSTVLLVGSFAVLGHVLQHRVDTSPSTPENALATTSHAMEKVSPPTLVSLDVKPWRWLSSVTPDGASTTPQNPEAFQLTFNASGGFSVETDCNTITGSYEARNGNLSLGSLASTKKSCEDSDEVLFVHLLSDVVSYSFSDGGQLQMITDNGTLITFR